MVNKKFVFFWAIHSASEFPFNPLKVKLLAGDLRAAQVLQLHCSDLAMSRDGFLANLMLGPCPGNTPQMEQPKLSSG